MFNPSSISNYESRTRISMYASGLQNSPSCRSDSNGDSGFLCRSRTSQNPLLHEKKQPQACREIIPVIRPAIIRQTAMRIWKPVLMAACHCINIYYGINRCHASRPCWKSHSGAISAPFIQKTVPARPNCSKTFLSFKSLYAG